MSLVNEEAFLDLANGTGKEVHHHEPRTLLYVLTKDPARDRTYVWVERYRGEESLRAHCEAPYVRDALSQLPDLLAEPPVLVRLPQVVPL
ncbi:MAG TPA: antibiotic biosynthesis monooxygenase [Nitriliruptorales bacterium]|nr:antibiotic biosynthesis monooxygenase [Nitriliruptorales bacterium]